MPQDTHKTCAMTFSDMAARIMRPSAASTIITQAMPDIADLLSGPDELASYAAIANGSKSKDGHLFKQVIITEDGTKFAIVVNQENNEQLHALLLDLHAQVTSTTSQSEPSYGRSQQFFPVQAAGFNLKDPAAKGAAPSASGSAGLGGGVSISNGIIGVNW